MTTCPYSINNKRDKLHRKLVALNVEMDSLNTKVQIVGVGAGVGVAAGLVFTHKPDCALRVKPERHLQTPRSHAPL